MLDALQGIIDALVAMGPRPKGDPGAMRALAAVLQAYAGAIEDDDAAFDHISAWSRAADYATDELRDVAGLLSREAGELAAHQAAWDRGQRTLMACPRRALAGAGSR